MYGIIDRAGFRVRSGRKNASFKTREGAQEFLAIQVSKGLLSDTYDYKIINMDDLSEDLLRTSLGLEEVSK